MSDGVGVFHNRRLDFKILRIEPHPEGVALVLHFQDGLEEMQKEAVCRMLANRLLQIPEAIKAEP